MWISLLKTSGEKWLSGEEKRESFKEYSSFKVNQTFKRPHQLQVYFSCAFKEKIKATSRAFTPTQLNQEDRASKSTQHQLNWEHSKSVVNSKLICLSVSFTGVKLVKVLILPGKD